MNTDFDGHKLNVGDSVIAYKIGRREIVRGKVSKLGKVNTSVSYKAEKYMWEKMKDGNYGRVFKGYFTDTTSFPKYQIAKVLNERS